MFSNLLAVLYSCGYQIKNNKIKNDKLIIINYNFDFLNSRKILSPQKSAPTSSS